MINRVWVRPLVIALVCVCAAPVHAWGPVTQLSIVNAAAHVLSREDHYRINRLVEYVQQGADISDIEQDELHPLFAVDAVGAIQREMILLQAVRGNRVDPYYAYRLGALGKLVVQATAPLAQTDRGVRAQYYADVEVAINGVRLQLDRRKLVDPRAYFSLVTRQAREQDSTIIVDYEGGIGFKGLAQGSLSIDASRSVNAVADVWYTIMSSGPTVFELSPSNMRDYSLGAIAFYLRHRNLEEVDAAYAEAVRVGTVDENVQKRIGDMYFDAGYPERGIEEYRKVLLRSPGRRDVIERLADYYVEQGDRALARAGLEAARDAFASALEADALHPNAQRKLLNVESQIMSRDERLIGQRISIEEARNFETSADEASLRRDYARAIALLGEAESRYGSVTDEFPAEARVASVGMRNVGLRMRQLKSEMIENAQTLSGSGFRFDARRLAAQTQDPSEQALKSMLSAEYNAAMRELSRQVTSTP